MYSYFINFFQFYTKIYKIIIRIYFLKIPSLALKLWYWPWGSRALSNYYAKICSQRFDLKQNTSTCAKLSFTHILINYIISLERYLPPSPLLFLSYYFYSIFNKDIIHKSTIHRNYKDESLILLTCSVNTKEQSMVEDETTVRFEWHFNVVFDSWLWGIFVTPHDELSVDNDTIIALSRIALWSKRSINNSSSSSFLKPAKLTIFRWLSWEALDFTIW